VYLPELAYRIGRIWDSLAYIDGFAGPWQTHDPDHADSSFGVAIEALRRTQKGLRDTHGLELYVNCVLVEKDSVAFKDPFKFVLLDPTGWADIPMDKLQPLLGNRSCEVLINLMTRHIIRFLKQPDREDSYKNLFARPGVIEVLRNTTPDQQVERCRLGIFTKSQAAMQFQVRFICSDHGTGSAICSLLSGICD
jgi:hypothetical protein